MAKPASHRDERVDVMPTIIVGCSQLLAVGVTVSAKRSHVFVRTVRMISTI